MAVGIIEEGYWPMPTKIPWIYLLWGWKEMPLRRGGRWKTRLPWGGQRIKSPCLAPLGSFMTMAIPGG